MFPQKTGKPAKGSVINKPGTRNLYFKFRYFGRDVTKSTGLEDTPDNRREAHRQLAAIMKGIERGIFRFAEAFPQSSAAEKEYFSSFEGWDYENEPGAVRFGDYVEHSWKPREMPLLNSNWTRDDYNRTLDSVLLPYFGKMTFRQITRTEVTRFVKALKTRPGRETGRTLGRKRILNILVVLRTILTSAYDDHEWDLPDPLRECKKHMPKSRPPRIEAFRYDEWMAIVANAPPYWRPRLELLLLTGLSISEFCGLRWGNVSDTEIMVVEGHSTIGDTPLKTEYRERSLPITKAIKARLSQLERGGPEARVFTMPSGLELDCKKLKRRAWVTILEKAGVAYKPPKTCRTTFATWALLGGMNIMVVQARMGHGSLEMVHKHYVKYVKGLEKDRPKILRYFGRDFFEEKEPRADHSESAGESWPQNHPRNQ